ncbi:MAG TPA: tRNA (N(6)-L-threonylcarbamoyladenosine(37)-C(2))-methylthiotransferase MtaB [Clostridiales bacterium]|nr:tRNA (N(6)-L-threonylcarbamoyladenosine(37)-C(2))-methylthiotransferase MtaB [Clostridiales bacterium]
MKIAFYTLGCKVNQYDTEVMRELLINNGHTIVEKHDDPDVFIINSCTVTAESDRKTRQLVRKYRRELPNATIVLAGCMPQAFPGDASEIEEADIVIGNKNPHLLLDALMQHYATGERIVNILPHEKGDSFSWGEIEQFAEHTRAFMKIEDGCEHFCTYCIIPTARGRVRSKSVEDICTEAQHLADSGYSEVVLVGINLSAYGKDINKQLCDAVEAVCSVDGIKRVRLGSLEPDKMSDDMLERLKNQPKFCPQFHLSLQSGCDETLKRMNRYYDTAYYESLVSKIRKMFENPAITTDIMVGFPGETEEEFEKSLNFVKKIKFAKAHVFAYSRRKGTAAYNMPGQVDKSEKERRSRIMIAATDTLRIEFLNSQVGSQAEVLLEEENSDYLLGYTKNYTPVRVAADKSLKGKIAHVLITGVHNDVCEGTLI